MESDEEGVFEGVEDLEGPFTLRDATVSCAYFENEMSLKLIPLNTEFSLVRGSGMSLISNRLGLTTFSFCPPFPCSCQQDSFFVCYLSQNAFPGPFALRASNSLAHCLLCHLILCCIFVLFSEQALNFLIILVSM